MSQSPIVNGEPLRENECVYLTSPLFNDCRFRVFSGLWSNYEYVLHFGDFKILNVDNFRGYTIHKSTATHGKG